MVSLHEYVRKVGGASHRLQKVEEPRMYLEMDNVINRPFPHSSQACARKHESEARVDKHQTWRTTPSLLRAVAVANIVVSLVAKVPFITIRGKKLIFHFFLFLWRQKVGIGGFWQLKDKKTETDLL